VPVGGLAPGETLEVGIRRLAGGIVDVVEISLLEQLAITDPFAALRPRRRGAASTRP
jgi:hypothetical protein